MFGAKSNLDWKKDYLETQTNCLSTSSSYVIPAQIQIFYCLITAYGKEKFAPNILEPNFDFYI